MQSNNNKYIQMHINIYLQNLTDAHNKDDHIGRP